MKKLLTDGFNVSKDEEGTKLLYNEYL